MVGEAGVGKTRIARESLRLAEKEGFATRWVVASASAQGLPLGAFTGLLDLADGSTPTSLSDAVNSLAPKGSRVVLGVDDAHLLDASSALMVHRLVTSRAAVVFMTLRSGEPAPDVVTATWKDGLLDRVEVRPLSLRATHELLQTALGGPVHSFTARRVWRLTMGNPLYLRLLVTGGIEHGDLAQQDGMWQWTGEMALTPGLIELVEARLETASDETAKVLDLLALSEPLTTQSLARLTDLAAVEAAEDLGLVSVEQSHPSVLQARLAHPIFGEVLRARLGVLRARRLRGDLTRVLARPDSGHSGEVLRLAELACSADVDPDLPLLMSGATLAATHSDAVLTLRLGAAAVAAGGGFEAQLLVAAVAPAVLSVTEAEKELDRLAASATNELQTAVAGMAHATYLAWIASQPEAARRRLAAVLDIVSEPGPAAHLLAVDALIEAQHGNPDVAASRATELLRHDIADVTIIGGTALVCAQALTGRADDMAEVASRALGATSAIGSGLFQLPLLAMQTLGLRLAGYTEAAVQVAEAFTHRADGLPLPSAAGSCVLGNALLDAGRLEEGLARLKEARAAIEPFGDFGGWRQFAVIGLTRASALLHSPEEIRAAAVDLAAHIHPTMVFVEPEIILAEAAVASAAGSVTEALRHVYRAAEVARARGAPAYEVLALQQATCLGASDAEPRLQELAASVQGPRVGVALAHAIAWKKQDWKALVDIAEAWEGLGDIVSAAEAAAQAFSISEHAGDRRASRHAQGLAARMLERCHGANTATLAAFRRPVPLTAREREVVTLAALGLTNREIADRLVVSVRTVEGHAHHAAAKLGVPRSEFAKLDLIPRGANRDETMS